MTRRAQTRASSRKTSRHGPAHLPAKSGKSQVLERRLALPWNLSSPGNHVLNLPRQVLIALLQRLRDHADVAHGLHEVHVARPARDDVDMQVAGDPGAGGAADVDADVDA